MSNYPQDKVNLGDYLTIFTEPEENNSIMIILVMRAAVFSFLLFLSTSEISRNCTAAILKISALTVLLITLCGVQIALVIIEMCVN